MAQTLKCNEVIRCRTSTTRRISVGFVALLLCGTMACRPEQTDTHEGTGPSPVSQTTRAKPFDCTADFKLAETDIRRVTELKSEGTFTLHQCTDLNADGLPEAIIRAEGSFFGANHPAFYIYTKSGTTLKRLAESISADMYKILPTRVKGWPGLSFQTQGSGEKPETFIENYVWDGQQYTHAPTGSEPTAAKTSAPSKTTGEEVSSAVIVSGKGIAFPDGSQILLLQNASHLTEKFGVKRDESTVESFNLIGYRDEVSAITGPDGEILSVGLSKDYPAPMIKTPEGIKIGDSPDKVKLLYPDLVPYTRLIGPGTKQMQMGNTVFALYLGVGFGNYISPSKHLGFFIAPDFAVDGPERVTNIIAFDSSLAKAFRQ